MQNEAFRAANDWNGPANSRNSLYFSLLAGNLGAGEGFARDCILRQQVSTAEKLCGFPLKGRENPLNSAYFALKPDSEKVSRQTRKQGVRPFSLEGRCAVRFEDFRQANAMRSQTDRSANANLTCISNVVHRKNCVAESSFSTLAPPSSRVPRGPGASMSCSGMRRCSWLAAATASRLHRSPWIHEVCHPLRWSWSRHPARRSFCLRRSPCRRACRFPRWSRRSA